MRMMAVPTRRLAWAGLAACLLPVVVAHGAERFLGMPPCAFCLLERKPYYLGLIVALAALLVPRRLIRPVLWLLLVLFAVATLLSFVHVGVELHAWPDPLPQCTVPDFSGMTMAQRIAAMPSRPVKPCEFPDYLVAGLPVSFAQMAFLYALAVCAGLATSLFRSRGRTA
jgi:disulfide bond formation protein DsbB